ncbi:MAG: hypothetical protein Q9212_006278, partial [Teloschistes hypoglaucus]
MKSALACILRHLSRPKVYGGLILASGDLGSHYDQDCSALIENGIAIEDFRGPEADLIASYLKEDQRLDAGHSVTDVPGRIDLDNHARVILALNLMDRRVNARSVLEQYKTQKEKLSSIPGYRGIGLASRCHILISVLEAPDLQDHQGDLDLLLTSVCEDWWEGDPKDVEDHPKQYIMMLLAKALMRFYGLWEQGIIDIFSANLTLYKLPLTAVQICNQTLIQQDSAAMRDSEQQIEILAYTILTLKALLSLSWPDRMVGEIRHLVEVSQGTLQDRTEVWMSPEYSWRGKVTDNCKAPAKLYCIAATNLSPYDPRPLPSTGCLFRIPPKALQKVNYLFNKLPRFQEVPIWKIETSVLEALMFLPELRTYRKGLPENSSSANKDEYVALIPATYVVVNNLSCLNLPSSSLWNMMIWTLGLFRMDEYIETELKHMSASDIQDLKRFITMNCEVSNEDPDAVNGVETSTSRMNSNKKMRSKGIVQDDANYKSTRVANIQAILRSYIDSFLFHRSTATAERSTIKALGRAIAECLNAQLSQSLLSSEFVSQNQPRSAATFPIYRTQESFTSYMREIGVPTFSVKIAFAFVVCTSGQLPTLKARFLEEEYAERVARMSRLFNDLTGVDRDEEEGNLNCVNFAEFHEADDDVGAVGMSPRGLVKERLGQLARFEREEMRTAGRKLEEEILRAGAKDWSRRANSIKLIGEVAELYTEIYTIKDISS